MKTTALFILLFYTLLISAPTPLGSNGIITVPSAYLYDDSELYIGYKYESEHFPFYKIDGKAQEERGIIAGFSFLPFVELSLRYNLKPHQDRLANIRVRILSEKKYRPALTLGFRDALTILRGVDHAPGEGTEKTSYYNSIYLVAGKSFSYRIKSFSQKVSLHLGGGYSDFDNALYQHLHGLFGGIEYEFHEKVPVKLLADYDTKEFRFGISGSVLNHVHATLSTWRFKEYSFVLTSSVKLNGLKSIKSK